MRKTFINEKGNKIDLDIYSTEQGEHYIILEGPNSVCEMIITRKEALELTRALVEFYTS